ncbi:hypothetical protein RZS08_43825, partial [Arthrospira platensis SPKY1]|nr:hypothetical protein [Arthrospira platensis SPKY1]
RVVLRITRGTGRAVAKAVTMATLALEAVAKRALALEATFATMARAAAVATTVAKARATATWLGTEARAATVLRHAHLGLKAGDGGFRDALRGETLDAAHHGDVAALGQRH